MNIVAFLSPNKLIEDDLTLNVLDISEAQNQNEKKSQGLLMSYTQVNSSSWQINATKNACMMKKVDRPLKLESRNPYLTLCCLH